LEAYRAGDKSNHFIVRDEKNFMSLAKRVAVFDHLKGLQKAGKLNVMDQKSKYD
jgi:hypothetical protein